MMEDPDHGHALCLQFSKPAHKRSTRIHVERGRRFVEQQQPLRQDQSPREVDFLLLAAGERGRIGAPEIALDAKRFQPPSRLNESIGMGKPCLSQRLGDDLLCSDTGAGDQELGDETDLAAAQERDIDIGGAREIDTALRRAVPDVTVARQVASIERAQQSGLADPVRSLQQQELTGMQCKPDAVKACRRWSR